MEAREALARVTKFVSCVFGANSAELKQVEDDLAKLRSAVEDQERLGEVERHAIAGRVITYGPYSKQFEVLEDTDDDEMHAVVSRGHSLRSALDAARTPTNQGEPQ